MLRFVQNSAPPIPARSLGKTGVTLPILGFGTAATGERLNTRDAVRLYETAFRAGITYFDTAPEFAGYGKAQSQLSHLLKQVRPQIFLVTKCYEPDGERALQLLERNLRELGTTYADLVFVHSVGADKMDPRIVFSKHGTYAALMKAKSLGLTRFVGLSGHSRPSRFLEALRQFDIDVLLNAVNFVDRHTYNFEEQVWPAAAQANIGLIAMKVFGGAQDPPPNTLSHSQMPVEYHDMAFRYALSQPHVCCATIGMATHRELEENLDRARMFKPLSIGEARRLHDVGALLARQWTNHFGPVT
ncbi:MAG TPA: aldo/keto reductase [Nitrospiraceae bacterium]|nr:aldo/keto reductase [Nitrospiraceae bacterium]